LAHEDLKKPKSHVLNNRKNECNLMNYLIGKETACLQSLAPEKEMGRKFKK
jgi:hypothetical protein